MSATPKQTTVLSTKGQVILPKAVRDQRGWKPGTKLTVEETPDGVLLKPEPLFPPTTLDQVYGCLKWDGPPVSLEDMDAAITAEVLERHARGRY
ncbi:MAG: AbrB/MazE/SpoVT family DNA-binding domain-containing protein [Caulobacter sp.]|nr:AbrB/MazE/SpoVT family DNA-binding domain-containing protein [Caulobacter sp.]